MASKRGHAVSYVRAGNSPGLDQRRKNARIDAKKAAYSMAKIARKYIPGELSAAERMMEIQQERDRKAAQRETRAWEAEKRAEIAASKAKAKRKK